MAKAGAIPPLVAYLSDGPNDVAKEHAAGVLVNLAIQQENKVAIAKAGGIAPLLALERDGSAAVKAMASKALKNLTKNNVDNEAAVWRRRARANASFPLVDSN